ncbi:hypothetical protein PVAND_015971 [Polypedilum vanderplanki]|uniref:Thiamin pyrophosphokinase thiamin-binding domain-containing protein n=1 Tax=Polypedilum vanderplanki TaxID=319348 RepID=A0A9J6BES4_POLVA|nr:hypothetical protein PVAND_015971 [Polypedilum vanderplanki]
MYKFFPKNILNIKEIKKSQIKYGVIILNNLIKLDPLHMETLWKNSMVNITVDGGTNGWLNFLKKNNLEEKLQDPNLITGDLDSCHAETLTYFKDVKIIQSNDQNENDFSKSLRALEPLCKEFNLNQVVVVTDNSGRLDQIMSNINTLYKNHLKLKEHIRPAYMLTSTELSWLLPKGKSEIHIPECAKKQKCALMPVGRPTVVSTEGLKWNLKKDEMKFGGLVSTSNKIDKQTDVVKIESDFPILWSMGIRDD